MYAIWRCCLLLLLLISIQCSIRAEENNENTITEVAVEVGENSDQQFENSEIHPLFEAVINGDLEGIDTLLKEGVTVDYQNGNGWTSAIYAVEYHKYESLLKVIDAGADLNVQERDGWTTLMFAAFHGDGAMVDLLLEHNSSPIQSNIHGALPYQIARAQEHPSEASVLHDAAVVRALELEDDGLLMSLLRDDGRVNIATPNSMWTPLIYFAVRGLHEQCLELIGIGANVNQAEADGWTPLLFAANTGHTEVVSVLLQSGVDVNARSHSGATALARAREGGFDDIVEMLLARGATESEGEEIAPESHGDEQEESTETDAEVVEGEAEVEQAETDTDTETSTGEDSEVPVGEEDHDPTSATLEEPVRTADSITHDPNPPGELDLTRQAVEEDFAKHKKRKGLFFW